MLAQNTTTVDVYKRIPCQTQTMTWMTLYVIANIASVTPHLGVSSQQPVKHTIRLYSRDITRCILPPRIESSCGDAGFVSFATLYRCVVLGLRGTRRPYVTLKGIQRLGEPICRYFEHYTPLEHTLQYTMTYTVSED